MNSRPEGTQQEQTEFFNEFINNLIQNQQPIDPEIQAVIDKEFWNLI